MEKAALAKDTFLLYLFRHVVGKGLQTGLVLRTSLRFHLQTKCKENQDSSIKATAGYLLRLTSEKSEFSAKPQPSGKSMKLTVSEFSTS